MIAVAWILVLITAAHPAPAAGAEPAAVSAQLPQLLLLDSHALSEARRRMQSGDALFAPALHKLRRDAERALAAKNLSVTEKNLAPPSGDKRDYMSIAPYWWPDPKTPRGLPYVRRDGEVNPERDRVSDRKRLEELTRNVTTLGAAYFYTGKDDYAAGAARLLRVWFLDNGTKMSPHLKYAQAVPGRSTGRAAGIIETHNLPELIDAVEILRQSKSWTETDQKGLQNWFDTYLIWLIESPQGKSEAKAQNNHGTWYDVQVASYALFAGRHDLAKRILAEFPSKRIAGQIDADGRQPHELARTQPWHYSIFNLEALFNAASIGERMGIDLWGLGTGDKRGIRRALDWLVPFAAGKAKWKYREISGFQPQKLAPLLRRASIRYREPTYEEALGKLPQLTGDERWQLLYPKP